MSFSYFDLHCHPSLKPYGKSFLKKPARVNSIDASDENSIWYYDSPNLIDRAIQMVAGISKFTQADFTTLAYGDVRLICASLYPIEQGFFKNKLGTGRVSDLVGKFVTGVGQARVDFIQSNTNYFKDVEGEYQFYEALHDKVIKIGSVNFKYVLIKNYAEIQSYLTVDPKHDNEVHSLPDNIIFVIISIEGFHVLNNNIDGPVDEASFLTNLRTIKAWRCPPFFVTFAHHFYNHLCGHAKSLTGIVGSAINQLEGINTGFTPLGKKVVSEALSIANGRRIYIDIKHMSAQSRREYFDMLPTSFAGQNIPVNISHGAANGQRSMDEPVFDNPLLGTKLLQEDINMYDNEILMVAQTKGIFGLQLDERRLASARTLQNVKHSFSMNKIRHYRAELVWNQIQYIAELLDRNDLPAWDYTVLGTDFEGIVNPLNGYLTAETITNLEQYVERYAFNYMNASGAQMRDYNRLTASEIVNRIFCSNGVDFLSRFF